MNLGIMAQDWAAGAVLRLPENTGMVPCSGRIRRILWGVSEWDGGMERDESGRQRILWIDSLRGVTIALVVLLHASMVLRLWFPEVDTKGPVAPLMNLIMVLSLVRMPAFFFCAGLVFCFAIGRGWRWFLNRRLRFALWVIGIWTLLSLGAEMAGLHLYPSKQTPYLEVSELFWVPYGNLWFMYALLVVSALALLLRPLPRPAQFPVVLTLGLVLTMVDRHVPLPDGLVLLVGGLAEDALVFFMLGVWWGPAIMRLLDDRRVTRVAVILLPTLGMGILMTFAPGGIWLSILVMLPTTLGFLAVVRVASAWEPGARLTAMLGRCSLEVFLLHQFFIAAVHLLLLRFAPGAGPVMVLSLLWLIPIGGSLLAAGLLRRFTGSLLFDAPARPVPFRKLPGSSGMVQG